MPLKDHDVNNFVSREDGYIFRGVRVTKTTCLSSAGCGRDLKRNPAPEAAWVARRSYLLRHQAEQCFIISERPLNWAGRLTDVTTQSNVKERLCCNYSKSSLARTSSEMTQ